jgi:DNA-binding Lrp family transcriptional regulator
MANPGNVKVRDKTRDKCAGDKKSPRHKMGARHFIKAEKANGMIIAKNSAYGKLLKILRNDARARFLKISRMTNIPLEDIYEIYNEMVDSSMIRSSSLIDFKMLDFGIRAFIVIDFAADSLFEFSPGNNALIEFLDSCPYVNSLSRTDHGIMMDVVFDSESNYESFITILKKFEISGLREFFVEREIIREKFMT